MATELPLSDKAYFKGILQDFGNEDHLSTSPESGELVDTIYMLVSSMKEGS